MGLDWSVFSWIQSYIIYTYRTAVASSYVEHVGVFILYICTVPVPHERQAITQSPVHNRYTLNTTVLEKLRSYTLILFIHTWHVNMYTSTLVEPIHDMYVPHVRKHPYNLARPNVKLFRYSFPDSHLPVVLDFPVRLTRSRSTSLFIFFLFQSFGKCTIPPVIVGNGLSCSAQGLHILCNITALVCRL